MPQKNGNISNVVEEAKKIWLIWLNSKPRSRKKSVTNGMTAPPAANCSVIAAHNMRGRRGLARRAVTCSASTPTSYSASDFKMSFWTKRIDKSGEFCWVAPSSQGERLGGG